MKHSQEQHQWQLKKPQGTEVEGPKSLKAATSRATENSTGTCGAKNVSVFARSDAVRTGQGATVTTYTQAQNVISTEPLGKSWSVSRWFAVKEQHPGPSLPHHACLSMYHFTFFPLKKKKKQ